MSLQNRSQYPISVDCVIFGYAAGQLQVALIKRKKSPFKGMWAIPGGFMEDNETVEQAAFRELQEETGLSQVLLYDSAAAKAKRSAVYPAVPAIAHKSDGWETIEGADRQDDWGAKYEHIHLEQFHVFSKPDRDPRGRVITVAFFALIAADKVNLVATEDAEQAQWFPAYDLPTLAFDHDKIFAKALESLRIAAAIKPIIFELLPQQFTLTMLQNIYEQIFGYTTDKRNFRKKILKMNYIQETKHLTKGEKQRPARLYRFNRKNYLQEHAPQALF